MGKMHDKLKDQTGMLGMKTAGVVIDDWKLAIFRKHLDNAGFAYTQHPGITPDTITLKVKYWWVADLQPVVQAAYDECAKSKRP
jgi:hypothetical protein